MNLQRGGSSAYWDSEAWNPDDRVYVGASEGQKLWPQCLRCVSLQEGSEALSCRAAAHCRHHLLAVAPASFLQAHIREYQQERETEIERERERERQTLSPRERVGGSPFGCSVAGHVLWHSSYILPSSARTPHGPWLVRALCPGLCLCEKAFLLISRCCSFHGWGFPLRCPCRPRSLAPLYCSSTTCCLRRGGFPGLSELDPACVDLSPSVSFKWASRTSGCTPSSFPLCLSPFSP